MNALRADLGKIVRKHESSSAQLGDNLGLAFERLLKEIPENSTSYGENSKGNKEQLKNELIQSYTKFEYPTTKEESYKLAVAEWRQIQEDRKDTLCLTLRSLTPLLLGSGNSSAMDIGIQLNKPWGIPYISGSSIKGLISSYLARFGGETWQKGDGAEKSLAQVEVFGGEWNKNSYIGSVTFHDAWLMSAQGQWFQEEIITVHHQEYYNEKNFPDGMDDPIPVKLLVLKPNLDFFVSFAGPKPALDLIKSVLEQALLTVGLGAKTAVGYGRFSILKSEKEKIAEILETIAHAKNLEQLVEVYSKQLSKAHTKNLDIKIGFKKAWESFSKAKESKDPEINKIIEWLYPLQSLLNLLDSSDFTLKKLNDEFKDQKKRIPEEISSKLKQDPEAQILFNKMLKKWPTLLTGPDKDMVVVKELTYSWEDLKWDDDLLLNIATGAGNYYMSPQSLKDFLLKGKPEGCKQETYDMVMAELS